MNDVRIMPRLPLDDAPIFVKRLGVTWIERKSRAGVVYRKPKLPPGVPGFFKRGALNGVVYQSHIKRAYV